MMMAEIAISVAHKSLPVNLADADGLLNRVNPFSGANVAFYRVPF